MVGTLTEKVLESRLQSGDVAVLGSELRLDVDQVLLNDSSGPLIVLELNAMGVEEINVPLTAAYMDHLLTQQNERNAEDHQLMRSAAERYGFWYAPPGSGVAHPVHQQHFGEPGGILVGSDSHTPAAGAIGQLGVGLGGIGVARVLAGDCLTLRRPAIWGIEMRGSLKVGVSAKDVSLYMLSQWGVSGAKGCIIEYFGSGLDGLSCTDRHVIANMGTELGAVSSLFPSDDQVLSFMVAYRRAEKWTRLEADHDCKYDRTTIFNLDEIEPMIALPGSPANAVTVASQVGIPICQAYIGSSGNPSYEDLAVVSSIVEGDRIADGVSLDINPASRSSLLQLIATGELATLVQAGARLHQAGCNGCIGMGQAPIRGSLSLRTVPRNFSGRSGTLDDSVALVSPETAAASSLLGHVADPRLVMSTPRNEVPQFMPVDWRHIRKPRVESDSAVDLCFGDGHKPLPEFGSIPDQTDLTAILCLGDNVSTDDILPGGSTVMPYWSDIDALTNYCFSPLTDAYVPDARLAGDHLIVAGCNYGQGSSREHAALGPRLLGLRVVIAKSFARIHRENLIAFGVLVLTIDAPTELTVSKGNTLGFSGLRKSLVDGSGSITARIDGEGTPLELGLDMTQREREIVLAGGVLNLARSPT